MLIDLIQAWKEGLLPELLQEQKKNEAKNTSELIIPQSSFYCSQSFREIFIKDRRTQERAFRYCDLPTLPLKREERRVYDQVHEELKKVKGFTNGKYHLLLTGAIYDTETNILFLEAVRADYVFLKALDKMRKLKIKGSALQNKDFFMTGVLAPFISTDDQVTLVTRNDRWKSRSVAAGYLECEYKTQSLSNLIIKTAVKEANEEFARSATGQQRIHFGGLPKPSTISFWQRTVSGETVSVLEFIAPIHVQHRASYVSDKMNRNTASHKHEHIEGSAQVVPLDTNSRDTVYGTIDAKKVPAADFLRQRPPGSNTYGPIIHTCAMTANRLSDFLPSRIPEAPYCRFLSMGIFKPAPQLHPREQSISEASNKMDIRSKGYSHK